jgi:hypothetical protein
MTGPKKPAPAKSQLKEMPRELQTKSPSCEVPPFPLEAAWDSHDRPCIRESILDGWNTGLAYIEGAKWAWAKAHEAKAGK